MAIDILIERKNKFEIMIYQAKTLANNFLIIVY
jgi:hypothetical protein